MAAPSRPAHLPSMRLAHDKDDEYDELFARNQALGRFSPTPDDSHNSSAARRRALTPALVPFCVRPVSGNPSGAFLVRVSPA